MSSDEDSCSSEEQEAVSNPLQWRNETFEVDDIVIRQENSIRRPRKGAQLDFEHIHSADQNEEKKETSNDVCKPPSEADSSKDNSPSFEQLNKYTCAVLKEKLKERGLKTTGLKNDLINRLIEDSDASSTESKKLKKRKKEDLKQLLTQRGLKVGGNKTDMVDRLLGREKKTRRKVKWTKSQGRALLRKLLLDEKKLRAW